MVTEHSRHKEDSLSSHDAGPSSLRNNNRDLPEDAETAGTEGNLPMDIRELLRALPTRDEIRLMLANMEESHRREAQDLRGEILSVQTSESSSSSGGN